MTDERLRRAWRAVQEVPSLLQQAHLDAFRDVRGAPGKEALERLDSELRRAGDGPWLPAPIKYHWYGFRSGIDVTISGQPVEIAALESFAVQLTVPRAQQILDGIRFAFQSAELITIVPTAAPPRLDGLLLREQHGPGILNRRQEPEEDTHGQEAAEPADQVARAGNQAPRA